MSVLEFFRAEDARFNEIPDDKLTEFIVQEYPEFLADKPFRKQTRSLFGQRANLAESEEQLRTELDQETNPLLGTAMGRAATRGFGQLVQGAAGFVDTAQAARRAIGLGNDPVFSVLSPAAREAVSGAAALPHEGPKSLGEVRSLSDLAALGIERGIGEQIPQLAAGAATAGAGLALGLAPKAASIFGAMLTTFPVETGGAFEEIKQRTGQDAPLTAAAAGAVNAFLETFGDSKLLERALGGDQIVGRSVSAIVSKLSQRAAKQGAREAGVEAAQELVTALAPVTQGASVPEDLGERLKTAAFLGGVGGGAISAGVDTAQQAYDLGTAALPTEFTRERDAVLKNLEDVPGRNELFYPNRIVRNGIQTIAPPAAEGAPPILSSQLPTTSEIPSSATPEELASLPGIGIDRARDLITPFQRLTTEELTQVPGIGFDRAEIVPVERPTREQRVAREMLERQAQDLVEFDRVIPFQRQEIVPFERAGIPFRRIPTSPDLPIIDPGVSFQSPAGEVLASRINSAERLRQAVRDKNASDASNAAQKSEAERLRVASLSREQLAAREILLRIDREREQSIAEAQTLESQGQPGPANLRFAQGLAARVDAMLALGQRMSQPPAILAPTPETDLGLTEDPGTTVAPSPIDAQILAQRLATQGPAGGVVAPLAPVESAPISAPTPPTTGTRRQEGMAFNVTPSQYVLDKWSELPAEEQTRAQNINGNPETNEGLLLQQFLHASEITKGMARAAGVELDAEVEATLEKVYQENALSRYEAAEANQLGFQQVFNRKTAFRDALSRARRMKNTAGELRGRVTSMTLETDTGEIVRPEVERAAQPQEVEDDRTRVLDFLDQFTNRTLKEAVVNLLADATGFPRTAVTPSKRRDQFEADPALQKQVQDFAKTISFTRESLANLSGTPLSMADVQAFAGELLPDLTRVKIIDDPAYVNDKGQPTRGQFRPGEAQPFILNAAFIGSRQDVREALLEELMHAVWDDSSVQDAWAEVQATVSPEDRAAVANYPQEQQAEEAAIRRVIREVSQREVTKETRTWIDRILDALKRLFGVAPKGDPFERILKLALQARQVASVGGIRDSLSKGYWKNQADVDADVDQAGDPEVIKAAAEAQGTAVPPSIAAEIQALGTTGEELVAKRLLKPISSAADMALTLANTVPAGPDTLLLANGVNIPSRGIDIAQEAVLKQSLVFQQLRADLEQKRNDWSDQLSVALSRIPEAVLLGNTADLYQGLADQLAKDYHTYLVDLRRSNASTFDAEIDREINNASRRVTEEFRGLGNAVASGLQAIAREIPLTALGNAADAQAWIGVRLADPRQPRLMSDSARDWLLQPIGRMRPPLLRDERIHLRLKAVKDLASDNADAHANIKAFQKAWSDRKVSPVQFAKKWGQLRVKYAESLEAMREIYRDVKRLDANYNGAQIAMDIMDRLLVDPVYVATVDGAVKHLQAGSTLREYEAPNGKFTGKIHYFNPLTDKRVEINLQPDVGLEKQNQQVIKDLLNDVDVWGATTTDRVKLAAWQKEAQFLERFAFGIASTLTTGWHAGGFRIPSTFQWTIFSRNLGGFVEPRGPAYQRIGNRLMQDANLTATLAGQIDRAMRRITEDHEFRTKSAEKKATMSHGWAGDAYTVLHKWNPLVLDPILSQAQNPTAQPYKVGDWIAPGIQVTKEDLLAAKAFKDRDNALFDLLQKSQQDSGMALLYYNPLQTAEEFMGKPLSRRSVDYGLKMPRRPLGRDYERGKIFTDKWINAPDGIARRALLAEAYDWVLMSHGLIGNTDKEFSPNLDKRDAVLFQQIRALQRSGAIPFSNLDELIQFAGDQLATPTISPAQAATEFELRLLGYVDTFTRNYNGALGIVPKKVEEDFKKLGLPAGITKSVGVGESPFLTPRGILLAPPSFYTYSTVDDQAWGALQTSVRSVMTLREIEAVQAAKAAMEAELAKYKDKNTGLIALEQAKARASGRRNLNPFASPRRRIARSTRQKADQGDLMYALTELEDNHRTLTRVLSGLQRVAAEHVDRPEDNQAISAFRSGRQLFTSALLQAITSVANNIGGGAVSLSLYLRGMGNWQFATMPAEAVASNARYVFDNIASKLQKLPGVDPAMQKLLKVPGFKKIVQAIIYEGLRFEQERARAVQAQIVDEPAPAERAATAQLFPETAGRVTDEEPNLFLELINRIYSMIPGVARTIETGKAVFPGGADRMINQGILKLAQGVAETIGQSTFKAWKNRDNGTAGWDDLTAPINRFQAKDLGQTSETAVNFWRQNLSAIGGLEALGLDHYLRQKVSGKPEPFLTEGQLEQLANEIARATNMGDIANTPLIAQGRGVSGEVRKSLFMLLRYPINFASVNENVSGRVYGDTSSGAMRWRLLSGIVAFLIVLAATSFYKEIGQEGRQLIVGTPRTSVSITQLMDDPSATDLLRYGATSLSSVMPFIGERLTQALGGTSNRPLLDATRIFAPLGLAYDLEQTAIKIWQTGDMGYPLVDLTRRYVPLSGTVLNRVLPGEVEQQEASRGLRLSAPTDIELRPQGGGTTARQTPLTPIMRTAVDRAMAGDEAGSKAALDEAVRQRVEAGQDEKAARSAVSAAFQSRDPERTVFGRELTTEERVRTMARMTGSQRRAYLRSRQVFSKRVFRPKARTTARRRPRKWGKRRRSVRTTG